MTAEKMENQTTSIEDFARNIIITQGNTAQYDAMPIRHVIFDFGNVLIHASVRAALMSRYSDKLIDQLLDDSISGFHSAVFEMDSGVPIDETIDSIRANHGEIWAEMTQYYVDNFEDCLTGPVPGSRMLVHDLKNAGIGVWGLSNWPVDLFPQALKACPVLNELDGKVVSGYVNVAKPNVAIYKLALHEFNISPQDCVFIDDKGSNVMGANEAGIRAIQFGNMTDVRRTLIDAGINIPSLIEA